jgi:hypothetical protein
MYCQRNDFFYLELIELSIYLKFKCYGRLSDQLPTLGYYLNKARVFGLYETHVVVEMNSHIVSL